jgi:hypothetical protein
MSRRSAECGGGSVGRGVCRWWCNPIPDVVLLLLGPASKLLESSVARRQRIACELSAQLSLSLSPVTHRNLSIGAVLFFCQLAALVAAITV